jgi:hypothetical protein
MKWGWVLAIGIGTACAQPAPPGPPAPTLDAIAEGYVRAALQLAQHDPSLVESWRGPESWRPGPRTPVKPIVDTLEALRADLDRVPASADNDRRTYLAGQLRALRVAGLRLLGATMTFDEEARESLGVARSVVDRSAVASARAELAGATGRVAVPQERREAVMQAALSRCREAVQKSITLPSDESVDIEFEPGLGFDATAEYLGNHRTRIRVNTDAAFDAARALHLACHEGYLGHHLQFLLMDDALVHGRGWKEFMLTPSFGPHLLVTEGAGEAATALAFPSEMRMRLVLEPLLPQIAGDYLDTKLSRAEAIDRLRDEALIPNPEGFLAFAEKRRARLLAYPAGRALVDKLLERDGLAALKRLFAERPFHLQ